MKLVFKYNLYKGISTLLGVGTPLITLLTSSKYFIYSPAGAISFTGVLTILIAALFLKDKLAENWKMPSEFILVSAILVIILLLEHILQPIKIVCIVTMIASGIDELTFKRLYKSCEMKMPKNAISHKILGFYFTTSKKLEKEAVQNE